MAKVEVRMPRMGESITEGTVIEWHKQPGDSVELDEPLLEIGTDKVDTDVPSPSAGVLSEILIAAGETVEVDTLIATIEADASVAVELETEPAPVPDSDPATSPAAATEPATEPAPAPSDELLDILMPKMGESIVEGTVIVWHKQVGDPVALDESLLEIGTDKVDTDVPAPAAGVVAEILVQEGETVEVGTRIAVLTVGIGQSAGTAAPAPVAESSAQPASPTPAALPAPAPVPIRSSDSGDGMPRQIGDGRFFSPLVRSIAEKEGLELAELAAINGSGREGRVTKKDVLAYIQNRSATQPTVTAPTPRILSPTAPVPQKTPGERVEIVKMDRMRLLISEHMTRSKATSAHVTSFAELDVTNLVMLRERNKEAFLKREGVKLTYTPFFVYAAVEALRDYPILNASVVGDEIHYRKDYHVGIAVALGGAGLVVPVIRNAGQRNLVGLAHEAADLAHRTRNKQLMPDDLQGGTFTVSNVGSLGSIMGTPIINQPQVGILATGTIQKRPVVIEDPVSGDSIGIRSMMYASLSYDHRVVDGAVGSSYLARFVEVIQAFDPNEVIR